MEANREYKSSVFSEVFGNEAALRELYCAIEGVELPPDVKITVEKLQNVLFFGAINDLSFEIGGKLIVLAEHQSTINPNMPLRLLEYITKLYIRRVKPSTLFGSRLIKLPRPEFFVLYNGEAPFPDEKVLRLSDAFEKAAEWGITEKTALDLEVKVYNINAGRNEALARKCKTLAQYSAFIDKVRYFNKELGNLAEAITAAIRYCREHDILKEFLEKHAAEVLEMLLTEWKWEEAEAFVREVSREEGLEEGREQGLEQGREDERAKIARNALAEGLPLEVIRKITGFDIDAIKALSPV
jgi:hypothetical protein